MSDNNIQKIYTVEVVGGKESVDQVQKLNKAFDKLREVKKSLNTELSQALLDQKTAQEIDTLKAKIKDINIQMGQLSSERKKVTNDAKAQAQVEKLLADVKLRETQIAKELAKTERERSANLIQQEKELDRQIDREAKLERQRKRAAETLQAEAGSYREVRNQMRELYALVARSGRNSTIAFGGETLNYDEAITKLKSLTAAEQSFRRQFQKDATLVGEYTTGIVQAFKELGLDDLVGNQILKANNRVRELDTELEKLKAEYQSAKATGVGTFDAIEAEMLQNRTEADKLRKEISDLSTAYNTSYAPGGKLAESVTNGFKNARREIMQFTLQYVSFQALLNGIEQGVDTAARMSDETTDLQQNLSISAERVSAIVDELAQTNTRTSNLTLANIANIAAKAGVAEENLAGVTRAIDTVRLAFGKDFGDIETGTDTIAKLISIFYKDGQVTEERVLKMGNGIRTLANETTASVPYITDFGGRMAGLKGIMNLTLPATLGLAAGFEQYKQSSEVASTALVKILPKLAENTAKYAAIANMTNEEFKQLLNNSPEEALLRVAEALKSGKVNVEEVSAAFADSELGSGRIATILGTMAENADVFRARIRSAGEATQSTASITAAAAAKNENFAATVDKINKKFSDAASSRAFITTLMVGGTVISFLLGNLPLVIGLLGLYALGWSTLTKEVMINGTATTVTNGQLLLQRATLLGNNIVLGATRLWTLSTTIAQNAYNLSLQAFTGVAARATVTTQLLGNAMRLLPLGIILTLLGVVAASFVAFGNSVSNSTSKLREQVLQQQALTEIRRMATQSIGEHIAKLDAEVAVIKNGSLSYDTRRATLQKLIDQYPQFANVLKGEKILVDEIAKAYEAVTEQIRLKAETEAAAKLTAEKKTKQVELVSLRQRIEREAAISSNSTVSIDGLAENEIDAIMSNADMLNTTLRSNGKGGISFAKYDMAKIVAQLKKQEKEAQQVYTAYLAAQSAVDSEFKKLEEENQKKANQIVNQNNSSVEVNIEFWEKEVERIDGLIKKYQGSKSGLEKLKAERKQFQDKLNDALGVNTTKASQLTGQQKDANKDIDAKRDELLAKEDAARLSGATDELVYWQNILRINNAALEDKLRLLKGKNAEERKLIAQYQKEKIENQKKSEEEMYRIRESEINRLYESEKTNAENNLKSVEENFFSSEVQKLAAKQKFAETMIAIENKKYQRLVTLDKEYAKTQTSRDNKATGLQTSLNNKAPENMLVAQKANEQNTLDTAYLVFQQKLNEVYNDQNLTIEEQRQKIGTITQEYEKQISAIKLNALRNQVQPFLVLQGLGLPIPDEVKGLLKQYWDTVNSLNAKSADESKLKQKGNFSLKNMLATFGLNFNKNEKSPEEQAAERMAQIYESAKRTIVDFYNTLIQNRQAAIDKEKEQRLTFMESEKARRLEGAKSQAEKDTIERKYQKEREKIEREAFEKRKKLQRAQVKIQLALELASIAAQAAANPTNALTFGASGIAQYAILSAMAIGRSIFQLSQINAQQFAGGGKVQPVKLGAGRIRVPSNIPQLANGDNVLATVKPNEVILNEQQQKALGGDNTFASIGVPGFQRSMSPNTSSRMYQYFASGGTQAPMLYVDGNGVLQSTQSQLTFDTMNELSQRIDEVARLVASVANAVEATDKKPVVANEVQAKANEYIAASKRGDL